LDRYFIDRISVSFLQKKCLCKKAEFIMGKQTTHPPTSEEWVE